MQLFTIGLVELQENGADEKAYDGISIPTYDTEDVTNFARAWTGFEKSSKERITQGPFIDPLVINPKYRDRFPKTKLKRSGYIGDTYPLCDDLPARAFLKRGARYVYTGTSSAFGVEKRTFRNGLDDFTPNPSSSSLYKVLCERGANGRCSFPKEVVLKTNLPCDPEKTSRPTKTFELPDNLVLKILQNNPRTESKGHTNAYKKYTVVCKLNSTQVIGSGASGRFEVTTPRNEKFIIRGVLHWAWTGKSWFFFPETIKASDLNTILKENDVLKVDYPIKNHKYSQECDADNIDFVKMIDPMNENNTVYYTYNKVPCV